MLAELESLNTPCSIEFNLSVMNDDHYYDSKRIKEQERREEATSDNNDNKILYVFELVSGHRDELHQIVQLTENWLS